jgi:hypothetical protein
VSVIGTLPTVWRASKSRYPGTETTNLSDLEPAFRPCVDALLVRLSDAGYRPLIYATWRDQERQDYYVERGWSQARGTGTHGRSAGGAPTAWAVDIVDSAPFLLLQRHAAFFLELRVQSDALGLESGGSWSRSHGLWSRWDLGWDPGHVQWNGRPCGAED